MLPVEFSHYCPVIGVWLLRAVGPAEQLVPFLVGIFHSVALAFEPVVGAPAGHVPRIMMQPPTPHPSESAFFGQSAKEPARPAQVSGVRPRTYESQVETISRNPFHKTAIFDGVLFRRESAAAAP